MGKIIGGILAIFLLLAAFTSPIIDGIKTWRTDGDTRTDTYQVTTGAGVTGANVTLSYDLYLAALAEVDSFSSNETGDTPVAATYTEATKVLEVTGLEASKIRTLIVSYYGESSNPVMQAIGGFLAVLIIGGLVVLIIIGMARKGH